MCGQWNSELKQEIIIIRIAEKALERNSGCLGSA
jgi:hypothetical protein